MRKVVLVDLHMPIVGALEFLKHMRAQARHAQTPVAVITGDFFLDELTNHALHDLGADVYFKPLWLEDLLEITVGLFAKAQRESRDGG